MVHPDRVRVLAEQIGRRRRVHDEAGGADRGRPVRHLVEHQLYRKAGCGAARGPGGQAGEIQEQQLLGQGEVLVQDAPGRVRAWWPRQQFKIGAQARGLDAGRRQDGDGAILGADAHLAHIALQQQEQPRGIGGGVAQEHA
ncbi:hypothetical protein D3C72_1161700 [compost metagenome]